MDKNKLAEMHKREECNQAGFATFVLIVSQTIFGLIVIGLYELAKWLIGIGG